jgi:hypothetical protein
VLRSEWERSVSMGESVHRGFQVGDAEWRRRAVDHSLIISRICQSMFSNNICVPGVSIKSLCIGLTTSSATGKKHQIYGVE